MCARTRDSPRLHRFSALAPFLLAAWIPWIPSGGAGAQSPPCTLEPTAGVVRQSIRSRSYELFVPPNLGPGAPAPLLVVFHGRGGTGTAMAQHSGWVELAQARGFVAAFPNGVGGAWQYGDVAFAGEVVDDLSRSRCIDQIRIFATGWSLGAWFSQQLACDASDRFASVTEYAGWGPGLCDAGRPISVGLFHGAEDTLVAKDRGLVAVAFWADRNGCLRNESADLEDGATIRRFDCDAGVEVAWREYSGQSHAWPAGLRRDEMLTAMWSFMTSHVDRQESPERRADEPSIQAQLAEPAPERRRFLMWGLVLAGTVLVASAGGLSFRRIRRR